MIREEWEGCIKIYLISRVFIVKELLPQPVTATNKSTCIIEFSNCIKWKYHINGQTTKYNKQRDFPLYTNLHSEQRNDDSKAKKKLMTLTLNRGNKWTISSPRNRTLTLAQALYLNPENWSHLIHIEGELAKLMIKNWNITPNLGL